MTKRIAILSGDGIGPEIIAEAIKVLERLQLYGLDIELNHSLIGGAAYDETGTPLPDETLAISQEADGILLGAVGGYKWDGLDINMRPERGLLGIRSFLDLFANLRPAILYPQLENASSLKPEFVRGLDLMIVRELTGGIYFGEPRGIRILSNGEKEGFNTLVYKESEIIRIGKVAFNIAQKRRGHVCSVDKANVLECTKLWRDTMTKLSKNYVNVRLNHMYVDNAAMQLICAPKQFDVIVTTNMFGDILSDCAATLTGSIGMLPSASLDNNGKGMYEPIHGSAPDIAGRNVANPLAAILSVAMMLRYTLGHPQMADLIEKAVNVVLDEGFRTVDIYSEGMTKVSTHEMGDAVVAAL
ncbi:MAG: 3-isopropylmalate dehydrogenase [Piscirickettsiaceae bacterium]|nr:3-isopropylmalate dehydrogenase [Piscirickettsiaceae bacterium]